MKILGLVGLPQFRLFN